MLYIVIYTETKKKNFKNKNNTINLFNIYQVNVQFIILQSLMETILFFPFFLHDMSYVLH